MPWKFLRVPQQRSGRLTAALLLTLSVLALLAVATKDPRTRGMGVLCPSRRFLGIYCPGCGSTRAMYDLMHGLPSSAVRNNPLMVFPGLLVLGWFLASLISTVAFGWAFRLRTPNWVGYTIAALLVAYGVLRNVPADSLEFLRPPAYAEQGTEQRSALN
jgi:Protein of unknown function (DUF2752)